jgi:hypothetical protein
MSVILLMLGIVVAAAGIATIGFGIPINEFSLGTTLIIAGTTALVGGFILVGLSAVVTELARVAEGLKARPATRPAAAAKSAELQEPALQPITQPVIQPPAPMPAPAAMPPPLAPSPAAVAASMRPASQPAMPAPRPVPELPVAQARPTEHYPAANPSAVEVSAAAIERLRSSIPRTERPRAEPSEVGDYEDVPLSPNGAAHHRPAAQPRAPAAEAPAAEPRVAAEDRGGAAVEALRASRLDFLFRSKPGAARTAPQPAPQPENFDAFWPADGRPADGRPSRPAPAAGTDAGLRAEQVERRADYAPPAANPPQAHAPRREPAPADEAQPPTILKSGVVDGMAYTLYSDGSIEAKLPQGTVRFGSIAELRAHIESNS